MNLNKKLIIVVFAVIFASCSTNNNIQVIDSENIKIQLSCSKIFWEEDSI